MVKVSFVGKFRLIFLAIVFLLSTPFNYANDQIIACDLVRVIDGDTAVFDCEGWNKSERVRFTGYNAPDKCQEGYKEATNWLKGILNNREITLKVRARDKYRRIVADVFVNQEKVKAPKKHRAKRTACR